jgi:hypothetical protein
MASFGPERYIISEQNYVGLRDQLQTIMRRKEKSECFKREGKRGEIKKNLYFFIHDLNIK